MNDDLVRLYHKCRTLLIVFYFYFFQAVPAFIFCFFFSSENSIALTLKAFFLKKIFPRDYIVNEIQSVHFHGRRLEMAGYGTGRSKGIKRI